MPLQLHKRAARLAPLLTGALVWTIHWWMVLTNAEHFFRRDLALFALPSKHYWLERVRQGALPEWTPLMSGGMPFLSDPANQTFYPLNLLLLLGDSTWSSLTWFVLGHSALSLAGFYLLARTLRIRPWIAVWGALIYTLSGYTLSITDNLNYLPATAWAPIALALYWRAIHQNMLVFAPLSGLSVGFIALGGDAVSASCLFGVMLVLAVTQKQISFRAHMQCVFIALLAGTLIACVQMVPAYPLIVESIRSAAVQGASAMSWSFPPIRGFELVQPAIIGNVQYLELASSERLYPGKGFPWAESVYVGMIPALVALASIGTRQVQLWLTLFLVAFALSLGSHLPGVPTIWSSLIAFGTQRYPEKLLLFVTLFLCIGAAVAANTQLRNLQCWWDRLSVFYRCSIAIALIVVGFSLLLEVPTRAALGDQRTALSAFWTQKFGTNLSHIQGLLAHSALLVIPLFVWLMVAASRRLLGPVVLIMAVADLLWIHHGHPLTVAEPIVQDATKAWAKLPTADTVDTPRIYIDTRVARTGPNALPATVSVQRHEEPFIAELIASIERLAPMIGVLPGLEYLNGHWSPLRSRLHAVADAVGIEENPYRYLRSSSVDFVVTTFEPRNPHWEQDGFTEVHRDRVHNLRIVKVRQSRPRVYVAHETRSTDLSLPSHERIKRSLRDECDCVFLDGGPQFSMSEANVPHSASVKTTLQTPEHLTAKVSSPWRGAVVFNESHAPGWSATVDGAPTDLYVANHRAMAVLVEPGTHRIAIRYSAPWFKHGAALSALGIVLSLVSIGWGWRLVKRERPAQA